MNDVKINAQNNRYWSEQKPHWFREKHTQFP